MWSALTSRLPLPPLPVPPQVSQPAAPSHPLPGLTPSLLPAPSHSASFPGACWEQREECLAPSQGRCPGRQARREAARTRQGPLRIPAPTGLLGACQAGPGRGGEPRWSQEGTGGLGRAREGRRRPSAWPQSEPRWLRAHPSQSPDGKTEAPWCQPRSARLFLGKELGEQGCCGARGVGESVCNQKPNIQRRGV